MSCRKFFQIATFKFCRFLYWKHCVDNNSISTNFYLFVCFFFTFFTLRPFASSSLSHQMVSTLDDYNIDTRRCNIDTRRYRNATARSPHGSCHTSSCQTAVSSPRQPLIIINTSVGVSVLYVRAAADCARALAGLPPTPAHRAPSVTRQGLEGVLAGLIDRFIYCGFERLEGCERFGVVQSFRDYPKIFRVKLI